MLKIGDFSKLSLVSVKALRLYDQMGLLKPVQVDKFTNYRYYSATQLPRLNRILALKDLGFSLEQIAKLIDNQIPPAQIRGMLRLKQAELQQHLEDEQARLLRVEARLRQIEQEDSMSNYDVVVKKVEPQTVAAVNGVIPNYKDCGPIWERLFDEVYGYVRENGVKEVGCAIAVYHNNEFRERDIEVEALAPIHEPLQASEQVKVYQLPAVEKMACVVHHGPFLTMGEAYSSLLKWIEANSYHIAGSIREVSVSYCRGGDQNNYVTEIQCPVEKA